jgi:hypothetical protein
LATPVAQTVWLRCFISKPIRFDLAANHYTAQTRRVALPLRWRRVQWKNTEMMGTGGRGLPWRRL